MIRPYKALKVRGVKVDYHRHLMEQHLGRKLRFDEVVHHKDLNKQNNSLDNLEVMDRREHGRLHAKLASPEKPPKPQRKIYRTKSSKLTVKDVEYIKYHLSSKDQSMATLFGLNEAYYCLEIEFDVTRKALRNIAHGHTWDHVPCPLWSP